MKMDNGPKLSITEWVSILCLLVVALAAVSSWSRKNAPAPTEASPQWLACAGYKTWCKVPNDDGGFRLISVQDFAKQHGYTFVGANRPEWLRVSDHDVLVFQVEKAKETPQ